MDLGNNLLDFDNHKIDNIHDLYNLFLIMDLTRNANPADIHKEIDQIFYDETECGAHLHNSNYNGFDVTCIVEGSSAEFQETFKYPFQSHSLGEYLCDLTARAHDAWCEANQGPQG